MLTDSSQDIVLLKLTEQGDKGDVGLKGPKGRLGRTGVPGEKVCFISRATVLANRFCIEIANIPKCREMLEMKETRGSREKRERLE